MAGRGRGRGGLAPETAAPLCVSLVMLGRDERARQVGDTALAAARAQHAGGTIARVLGFVALNEARLGHLLRAEVLLEEFDEVMAIGPTPVNAVYAEAARAWVAFLRGEYAEAERAIAAARAAVANPDSLLGLAPVWLVQGWVALAMGRPAEATGHLERIHDRLRDAPIASVVLWPFHTALVESYLRVGRADEARRILAEVESITPSMPGWFPKHLVHRIRGMIDGDDEAFAAALEHVHPLDARERCSSRRTGCAARARARRPPSPSARSPWRTKPASTPTPNGRGRSCRLRGATSCRRTRSGRIV